VAAILATVQLAEQAQRMPHQLSGGQQQRVGLARALVVRPKVLLMDEPLSNLDAKLRVDLRRDIRALQQSLDITTVYVTHDQEEALSISDRVCVMHDGVVQQVDTPWAVYNRPANRFVANPSSAATTSCRWRATRRAARAAARPGAGAARGSRRARRRGRGAAREGAREPPRPTAPACSAMRWCARPCSPAASYSSRCTWKATARSTRWSNPARP
jgi:iron(III) transport system ATP-binding protein